MIDMPALWVWNGVAAKFIGARPTMWADKPGACSCGNMWESALCEHGYVQWFSVGQRYGGVCQ